MCLIPGKLYKPNTYIRVWEQTGWGDVFDTRRPFMYLSQSDNVWHKILIHNVFRGSAMVGYTRDTDLDVFEMLKGKLLNEEDNQRA
jgi:hypothetical protein